METKKTKGQVLKRRLKEKTATLRLAVFTLVYGLRLELNPDILRRYSVYELIKSVFDPIVISRTLIAVGIGALIGVLTNKKGVQNFFSVAMAMSWAMMGISTFISSPPNAIWLFCAFITILCYEAIWVD